MNSFVLLFWRICTFKTGPDMVPANQFLVGSVIFVDAIVNVLAQVLLNEFTWLNAATAVVVNMAVITALVYGLLSLMDRGPRFTQTIGALFGADILLTTLISVALFVSAAAPDIVSNTISMASLFWQLTVFGFIYHKALEIHIAIGIGFAFFSIIFSFAVALSVIS